MTDPDYFQRLDEAAARAMARHPDLAAELGGLADRILGATTVVAFTGAGISTESGIPDFRSPGGVWSRLDPADFTFGRFVSDEGTRRRVWERFRAGRPAPAPNEAHRALARLESLGRLAAVITQNVDGLHQDAGSRRVIELHGTARRARCLACGRQFPMEAILDLIETPGTIPLCPACGGMLKPATVSFGEALPADALEEASHLAASADLMLVIGSSLEVYPAAGLPDQVLARGGTVAVINLGPTPLDAIATVRLWGKAGALLPPLAAMVADRLGAGA